MIEISKKVEDLILYQADSDYPIEMCGVISDTSYNGNWFFAIRNVAENPYETFVIQPEGLETALKYGKILAIVHSHPNGEPFAVDFGSWRSSKTVPLLPSFAGSCV